MKRFGLKLWSKDFIKNKSFVDDAEKSIKEGKFAFLELYALPFIFDEIKNDVFNRFNGIDVVIHAPHSLQDLDIANKDEFENNKKRLYASQKFADLLGSDIIILHPGLYRGEQYLEESIRQFKNFNDSRLTVENLPGYCSQSKRELHGVLPVEIKRFIDETRSSFCLDFSHAICGANTYNVDVYQFLSEFVKLNPVMYHLCDGDIKSDFDNHLHFGEGNFDLRHLVNDYTKDNALITMETGYGIPTSVDPWLEDIKYIQQVIS